MGLHLPPTLGSFYLRNPPVNSMGNPWEMCETTIIDVFFEILGKQLGKALIKNLGHVNSFISDSSKIGILWSGVEID